MHVACCIVILAWWEIDSDQFCVANIVLTPPRWLHRLCFRSSCKRSRERLPAAPCQVRWNGLSCFLVWDSAESFRWDVKLSMLKSEMVLSKKSRYHTQHRLFLPLFFSSRVIYSHGTFRLHYQLCLYIMLSSIWIVNIQKYFIHKTCNTTYRGL